MSLTVISVKQLNTYVRSVLEGDINLASILVSGELSNIRIYSSGHMYFSLKDNECVIKGVIFSSNLSKLSFVPKDGIKVVAKGKVTLYEKDGSYQIICETLIEDGQGDVSLKFKYLKDKLSSEGLFLKEHKKPLPIMPNKIAVVTSKDGAALQDIISVLTRRYPICELQVFPSLVQGSEAPKNLVNSLKLASKSNSDLIIIGRGGGSYEDLDAFNDEELARLVYSIDTPIISAVGHETDFTIIDYVSDMRAPTPSAAAELAVPNIKDIISLLNAYNMNFRKFLLELIKLYKVKVEDISKKNIFLNLQKLYSIYDDKLNNQAQNFIKSYTSLLKDKDNLLNKHITRLNDLNPLNVLSRGYSLIYNNDKIVKSIDDVNNNDVLKFKTKEDEFIAKVIDLEKVN